MGIGPVPASKAALKAAGKEVKDMDIIEVGHTSLKSRLILCAFL